MHRGWRLDRALELGSDPKTPRKSPWREPSKGFFAANTAPLAYAAWMLDACLPLGPCVTSKETFWPSLRVLKPCIWIAEKCAKRSSLPSSGVMNPYPFASLNHFTVPVAIRLLASCYTGGVPHIVRIEAPHVV